MSIAQPPSPTIVLLSAPPIGAAAWDEVITRLSHHGLTAVAPDLFSDTYAPALQQGGIEGLADALMPIVSKACLVAHGQAVPLALLLARRASPARLVLSNGPIGALDPVTASACRLARTPTARLWSRPELARPLLASSLALRRLVVNPYVMDREMVDRVTRPWTEDRTRRRAFTRWMQDLPRTVRTAPPPPDHTLLVWGDEDRLYPAHVADKATGLGAGIVHHRVPGGRHLHPIERPWELADAVSIWLTSSPTGDRPTTG